jgi:hypothetical protein
MSCRLSSYFLLVWTAWGLLAASNCAGPPSFVLRKPSYKFLSEPGLACHTEDTANRFP